MKPDRKWFLERMRAADYPSMAQLAAKMKGRQGPLDGPQLSRRLDGHLDFTLDELVQFARLTRTPVLDVLRHTGVKGL